MGHKAAVNVLMRTVTMFGNISGGAFNPAVAFGISLIELSSWPNMWTYLPADFAGGAFRATL
jgi:glycerol uptake facilitator-like aquaporin